MPSIGVGIGTSMSPPAFAQAADHQADIAALLASGGDAWTLDETSGNFTGAANGVVLTRSGSLSTAPDPKIGEAVRSFSNGDRFTFPTSGSGISPAFSGQPFSIAFWFRCSGSSGSAYAAFFRTASNKYPLIVRADYTFTDVSLTAYGYSIESNAASANIPSLATVRATQDDWIFVVVTHTGAGGITINVNNGALTASAQSSPAGTWDMSAQTPFTAYGCEGSGGGSRFHYVDEFLLVPGILSADQIAWLYNSGAGRSMSVFA